MTAWSSPADPSSHSEVTPRLSVWDAAAIVIGIVVGAGIFESATTIARCVDSVGSLLAVWAMGGLVAGCVAELATRFPQHGGDYLFLRNAYGEPLAFVFVWTGRWVVRPGSSGALAFVFARSAQPLIPFPRRADAWHLFHPRLSLDTCPVLRRQRRHALGES